MSFYILTSAVPGAQTQVDEADALYARRADPASAVRGAEILSAILSSDSRAFDAAWKLSRISYWLGGHTGEQVRRRHWETGVSAGRQAAALRPDRAEGHFWFAANMGALAESSGALTGLRSRTPIREALETVLRIDPSFQRGSADRALGRWYSKVPRLFGGSSRRAEEHLRASLTYDPDSTVSHFFLAELLLDTGRKAEALVELQHVLDAPFDVEWAPEDQDYKTKARALLQAQAGQIGPPGARDR